MRYHLTLDGMTVTKKTKKFVVMSVNKRELCYTFSRAVIVSSKEIPQKIKNSTTMIYIKSTFECISSERNHLKQRPAASCSLYYSQHTSYGNSSSACCQMNA